jgi:hypothetical protein
MRNPSGAVRVVNRCTFRLSLIGFSYWCFLLTPKKNAPKLQTHVIINQRDILQFCLPVREPDNDE